MKTELRVADLIEILKTMPQDAIVVSDDGTGWLAKVEEGDVYADGTDDFTYVQICGNGEGI
jgi:hypothetical protein